MSVETQKADVPTLPEFDFVSFFEGPVRVSGWFSDRFGTVRRHFCGDFVGTRNEEGGLVLDEALYYSDGMVETRVWEVVIDENGKFSAVSDSLVNGATGIQSGNALNMQYIMNVQIDPETTWKLSMNDFMFLQADGSLHNVTHVKKFGVRIGTVSAQYFRSNEENTVAKTGQDCVPINNTGEKVAKVANL